MNIEQTMTSRFVTVLSPAGGKVHVPAAVPAAFASILVAQYTP